MANTDIIKDINALDPKMKPRAEAFLKKCKELGVNIAITETKRSKERQQYLYAQGRTRPGNIVTWTLQSNHILGLAMDIVFVDSNGKYTYNGDWNKIGPIAEDCGLIWGGTWNVPDKPHVEFNPKVIMDQKEYPTYSGVVPYEEAVATEKWFIDNGYVKAPKQLDAPLTRAEFYVILKRILEKK